MKKRGLGQGLDALLGGMEKPTAAAKPSEVKHLPMDKLIVGKFQPRRNFSATELAALADSIRQHGVLQPILVRQAGKKFEVIAGERRMRAAKMVGVATVPVVIRAASDKEAQLFALIENLQRADLNPMEQANGLAQLIEEQQLTHADAGEKVGLSRSAVSNLLRLRELSAAVQKILERGELEMGHARALLPLPKNQQEVIAKEVVRQRLTVRDTERMVRRLLSESSSPSPSAKKARAADADTRRLERELSERLSMQVEIRHRANGGGKMVLHYESLNTLDKVLKKLR